MRILEVDEKRIYDGMMSMIKFRKLRCWNLKAPEGFENHEPCEDSKNW